MFYEMSSLAELNPVLLAVILIWSLIWKGIALWISARKTHKIWFVVLLIINTVGVLEILYIFVFSKMSMKKIRLSGKKQSKTNIKK